MYKGDSQIDAAYYFCPYLPGMTGKEVADVNTRLLELSKEPTDIQKRIMEIVRFGIKL